MESRLFRVRDLNCQSFFPPTPPTTNNETFHQSIANKQYMTNLFICTNMILWYLLQTIWQQRNIAQTAYGLIIQLLKKSCSYLKIIIWSAQNFVHGTTVSSRDCIKLRLSWIIRLEFIILIFTNFKYELINKFEPQLTQTSPKDERRMDVRDDKVPSDRMGLNNDENDESNIIWGLSLHHYNFTFSKGTFYRRLTLT